MGLTKETFGIRGSKGTARLEFIVDTGSVYTWIPAKVLEKIGVVKDESANFSTIEGRRVRRAIGEATLEYDGVSRHCVVVFGNEGDATVLGVTALENMALEVDPPSRKLRRSKALAAYRTK